MQHLKELPSGTIWPHLIEAIKSDAIADLRSYAQSRKNDVARNAETPALAALLVEKYAAGMAKALTIVGIDAEIFELADQLVRDIDPDFEGHQKSRWQARPADICYNLPK